MVDSKDVESARKYVEGHNFTKKEIKLVRRMMRLGGLVPGLPHLSKAAREEVLKILDAKEKEIKEHGLEY